MQGPPISVTNVNKNPGNYTPGVKHSGFFITVSLNCKPSTQLQVQSQGQLLNDIFEEMFSEQGFREIIKFLPPHQNDDYNSSTIQDIDAEFAVELGSKAKGGRVHGHALVKVNHFSKIQLDLDAMRSLIRDMIFDRGFSLIIKGIHLDVKSVPAERNLQDYIRKSPLQISNRKRTRTKNARPVRRQRKRKTVPKRRRRTKGKR